MIRPLNLTDAMAKAQIFEERNKDLIRRYRRERYRIHQWRRRNRVSGWVKIGAEGGPIATPLPKSGGQQFGESRLPINCLTPTEI